jgi:hypothetical protein
LRGASSERVAKKVAFSLCEKRAVRASRRLSARRVFGEIGPPLAEREGYL